MNDKHSCDTRCSKVREEVSAEFKPNWNSLTHLEQAAYLSFHGATAPAIPVGMLRNILRKMFRWTQR